MTETKNGTIQDMLASYKAGQLIEYLDGIADDYHRKSMLAGARYRARHNKVPFDLTLDDIQIPEFCPILGIKLIFNSICAKGNSPSLDRFYPAKGYVKGNVTVISNKANTVKSWLPPGRLIFKAILCAENYKHKQELEKIKDWILRK